MKDFATLFAIGDNVILAGAIVYLARKHGPLRLLVPEKIFPSVSTFYLSTPEIKPVIATDEEVLKAIHAPDETTVTHNLLKGPGYEPWESFDRYVYRNLGVPLDAKWECSPLRASAELVPQMHCPPGIPLLIDDPSRDFCINRFPLPPYARVTDSGGSILQYASAIENASEVHVIDGCFLHLTDLLEPDGQLYYHRYARSYAPGLKDFALRHGWNVYAYGTGWDNRLASVSTTVTVPEGESLIKKSKPGKWTLKPEREETTVQTAEGYWILKGDPHGSLSTLKERRLDWDTKMLRALHKYIRPGSVVLDIGAHIGCHTHFYLNAVGLRGKVIAFEPYWEAYACLRRNCPEATCYNLALGDYDGFCDFRIDGESKALNQVTSTTGVYPMRRLDSLRDELGYLKGGLSFMKIDVEGYELKVLHGAEQLLREFRPVLCIEINEPCLADYGASRAAIDAFLTGLNYRVEILPEGWSDIIGIPA